jgi:hypothetical protein
MNLAVRGIDDDIRWNDEGSFHKDPGRWREPGRERRGPTSSGEFVVLAPLVGVAGVERLAHPIQHLVIELQSAQQPCELLFDNFLANIGLLAAAFVSGTMVIDVSLLLDLADDRAAAVPASDKTRERKIVLHSPVLFGVDVSLLLDLADDRAAAVPASDKTRERKSCFTRRFFLA